MLSLLLVRAAVAETGSASECLHGRDPRALSAAGVAAFLRCFAQRAGANLAAPVLASGLLGEELSALSAGEMQDALQLSPAHAELLHNVLDVKAKLLCSACLSDFARQRRWVDTAVLQPLVLCLQVGDRGWLILETLHFLRLLTLVRHLGMERLDKLARGCQLLPNIVQGVNLCLFYFFP